MAETNEAKIQALLTRGVDEVVDRGHLEAKLRFGKKIRVKLGIDPTSPNIHVGRAIPLLKLRDFQELGHQVVLIIGDFTGIIGDTSDKDSERPMLDAKTIKANMKNYAQQAGKVLDIRKCEVHYNSKWLKKLGFAEIGAMADKFGLHEFESRENVKKRMDEGKRVSLREILYPIMQGYDSVAIKADVELGGTDQRFNVLAGREIQRQHGQEPQDIMTNPLLEGTDGRKMSSSWGNTINLTDSAQDMFGKTMSIPDTLIEKYLVLATRMPMDQVTEVSRLPNPRDQKVALAKEIVRMYHGEKAALAAAQEFENVFSKKELPADLPEFKATRNPYPVLDLLCDSGLAVSKSDAKRLIEGGGVAIIRSGSGNEELIGDWRSDTEVRDGDVVRRGSRQFKKIRI